MPSYKATYRYRGDYISLATQAFILRKNENKLLIFGKTLNINLIHIWHALLCEMYFLHDCIVIQEFKYNTNSATTLSSIKSFLRGS